MESLYWIIIATIASASPILLVKEYLKRNDNRFIILSIMSYLILVFSYIHLLKKYEISKIYSLIKIAQLLIVSLIAIQLHKETINKNKIIGLLAGIVSIIYLSCS
jgi:multidrug transporter EmrE-like cation transporter